MKSIWISVFYLVFGISCAFAQEADSVAAEDRKKLEEAKEIVASTGQKGLDEVKGMSMEGGEILKRGVAMLQVPPGKPGKEDKAAPKPEASAAPVPEIIDDGSAPESLTEGLAQNAPANEGGSWIGAISGLVKGDEAKEGAPEGESLEGLVEESKASAGKKRSNAAVFDVSGAMLRMSAVQIDKILTKRGYKKISQKLEIPNFIKWRNEEACRNSGVVGYERLANCVVKMAGKEGHEFVETANYSKFDTQEEIEVKFVSNFTANRAYRIIYKSMSTNIGGNSPKMLYLRNIKVYDFWKRINQKYGPPDDREAALWGMGEGKPYLHAVTGRLMLEDPMLQELDYTRMAREDSRYLNTNLYNF